MVDKTYLRLLAIVAASFLQGCSYLGIGSGDFSCPGGADGVRCMSARQIYQATESSDYVKTTAEADDPDKRQSAVYERPPTNPVAIPSIGQPIPIRTQARVMRIWTSSWEDDEGDLHADGYMYTEIESRRWNLGDRFQSPGSAISPLSATTNSSK